MGLLRHSVLYLLGRVLPAAIGLGSVGIYTRLLDPASVGAYAVLLASSLLASAICYTWLRVAALRLAAGGDDLEPDLAATVGWSFAGISALVALVEGGWLHVYKSTLSPLTVGLAVAAAVSSAWYDLTGTLLQARLNVVAWGVLNFVRAAAALGLTVGLIFAGFKTDALLAGFVLGNCGTLVFLSLWRPALRGRFDRALCRRLFRFGWPTSINSALGRASPTAQRYLLEITGGGASVGLFSVAADFSTQTMSVLIGSISLAGIPLAFRAKDRGDLEALARQLRENARLIFALALPAAVGLAVLADPIAHVFLGPRFRADAGIVISIVTIATFAGGLRIYYFDQAFELSMRTHPQAVIAGVSTGVELVLDLIVIPRYGIIGAAWVGAFGQIMCLAWSILWGNRIARMPVPTRSWLKTSAAVAGMIAAIEAVPARGNSFLALGSAMVLAGFAYLVLSTLLRINVMRAQFSHRFASPQIES